MGQIREFRRRHPVLFRTKTPMAFSIPPGWLGEAHRAADALERIAVANPERRFWAQACVPTGTGLLLALGGDPPDEARLLVCALRERTAALARGSPPRRPPRICGHGMRRRRRETAVGP